MKLILLALCALAIATPAFAACPPAGYDRARLDALKAADFALADDAARNALARAMSACLADPDPHVRDEITFEAYFTWMRHRQLTDATMLALESDLEARLTAPEGQGFERPFAALALAEVARADRVQAYLPAATRARLLIAAISYFTGIHDYRGFDESEGWRHGVAHGSDLLMQLALNPALTRDDLIRIRDAVATQIAPAGVFYQYGEGERLGNPILYIASRNFITEAEWTAWFAAIAARPENPAQVYSTQAGLARVHDVKAFLFPLWANVSLSQNAGIQAMKPGLEAALRALPN